MVAPPEDEPEWDCDADMDVLLEVQVIVPINDLPQAPPARQRVRIRVDMGGVLCGKETQYVRRTIRTVERVVQMLAAGARVWFEECVEMCGAMNLFIINYLCNPIMQGLYTKYWLGAGGLMQAIGVPLTT